MSNLNYSSELKAKWLIDQFKAYKQPEDLRIENVYDFIERIKDEEIEPYEILVPLDVVKLFTNIPIFEKNSIMSRFENNLEVNNELYRLDKSF